MARDPTAAYLHVPFCRHQCGYCDFAVVTGRDQLADMYLDALEREVSGLGESHPVDTIFIGGGTPTALAPPQIERLLTLIRRWLPLNPGGEWSIESTPDTLDAECVAILSEHGVTRVSIGVQSFRESLLKALDRLHAPADNGPAVARVKARIAHVSLDLIFGIPGQTPADWRADLAQALELEPDHLSCYGLTYEKGTPLWKAERAGRVTPVDEESERTMFLDAHDTLTRLGWDHYEISNYARPGRRCRHNETYWANQAYFGFGLGAARYVDGRRELNTRSFDEYLGRLANGTLPTIQSECLELVERARETLTVQLRRREGVDRKSFYDQTGCDLDRLAGPAINRHVARGLLADNGSAVALTREGLVVADAVLAELLACNSVE